MFVDLSIRSRKGLLKAWASWRRYIQPHKAKRPTLLSAVSVLRAALDQKL